MISEAKNEIQQNDSGFNWPFQMNAKFSIMKDQCKSFINNNISIFKD